MPAPTNADDVIDSRDVITRIDELEYDRADIEEKFAEAEDHATAPGATDADAAALAACVAALKAWDDSDDGQELKALRALASEAEDYAPDWQHGATLVRESYWPTYARELVEDVGDLPKNLPHYIVINWEATADNLLIDYTPVEFDGVTYLIR